MMDGPRLSVARFRQSAIVIASVAVLLGALMLFFVVSGANADVAALAMVRGALGSRYAILSATLVRAIPLILTGLAVAWAFSAGVFNIGVEGQFIVGASAAAATALEFPSAGVLSPLAALLAGALAGAAWAGVAAWLRARFAVLEVISTIMLNFLALQLLSYLVHGPLGDPNGVYPQSPSLSPAARLPNIIPGTRLVSVQRVTTTAFLVSGAIAGLAGAVEVTGVTYALYESISPGYGYTAIAVALLANLNPAAVIVSGVGFGALEAGAAAMQRDAGVPAVIASVIEALIILALATAQRRQWFADAGPAAPTSAAADGNGT